VVGDNRFLTIRGGGVGLAKVCRPKEPKKRKSQASFRKILTGSRDIAEQSLDIIHDMTKMTVVLSSAMQAGAVAHELDR
jgi:hypothetical protein